MARATTDQALTRRAAVAELELEGATAAVIAKALGSDYRTVQRDLAAIAQERAQNVDLAAERHRLVEAARLVERESWALFRATPSTDANGKLGALAKVLAAQAQGAKVIADLANADLERRMEQLEQLLQQMQPATHRRGR